MSTVLESSTIVVSPKTVVLAEHHGFCHGVKKAVDKTLLAGNSQEKPVYVLGQLIHNQQVIDQLDNEGITTVQSLESVPSGSLVVIRTHGAPPELLDAAEAKGIEVKDATCPDVRLVQNKAIELAEEGYTVILVGQETHPEIIGITAHAKKVANAQVVAINQVSQIAERLEGIPKRRIGVVSQTTQLEETFFDIVRSLSMVAKELKVFNTICPATFYRQNAALELAPKVDFMVVVGGKNSSNTSHLADICRDTGTETVHIETYQEIENHPGLMAAKTVGVTAGASTPDWVIEDVVTYIQRL